MPKEIWYQLFVYLLNILIVLALIFALVEASRKYDRFRHPWQLTTACGYCLLLIWAIIRALDIPLPFLNWILLASQGLGFLLLAIGYHGFASHHHSGEEDTITKSIKAKPVKSVNPSDEDWVGLLSSDSAINDPVQTKDLDQENEIKISSPQTPSSNATDEKEVASKKTTLPEPDATPSKAEPVKEKPRKKLKKKPISEDGSVDLSYLAERRQKKNNPPKTKKQTTEQLDVTPLPTESKVENKADAPPAASSESDEKRDELLDDLFPIKHEPAEPIIADHERPTTEVESTLPGEKRQTARSKKQPAAFALTVGNAGPVLAIGLLNLWIIISLIRSRRERGVPLLLLGFTLILVITCLPLVSNFGLSSLALKSIETVGYLCLAIASWIKIKGKVTHHFLFIITLIYLALLGLTIALAYGMVRDQTSYHLLTLFVTGILIITLPIIHSLAYDHPHLPPEGKQSND